MTNKKPAEQSNEELLKNEKTIKGLTLAFAVVLIVLFVTIIFLTIKKGFSALSVVPIALLPILIIGLNNWNELKKEIKLRSLQ